MAQIEVGFEIGARVIIDGDKSIVGTIVQIAVFYGRIIYEVAWFHSGTAQAAYFDDFRLAMAAA